MQRLGDQDLADIWAVGVRGVDEVDVQLDGPAQDVLGPFEVGRVTPDTAAGYAHGSEAEAIDGEIAAEIDRAGSARCDR